MEYNTLKLKIKPLSPFKTQLQSDTIFGMFCWNYLYLYSEERLKKLLGNFEATPSIVFSDGFFEGYLPKPLLEPLTLDGILLLLQDIFGESDREKIYSYLKKIKKKSNLSVEAMLNLLKNKLTSQVIYEAVIEELIKKDEEKKMVESASFIKNSVNRITGTVDEGLYQSKETFYGTNLEIYIKYLPEKISKKEIEEVFRIIGDFGYGADKSTGKGRFKIVEFTEDFKLKQFLTLNNSDANAVISLSSTLPSDDIELLYGKTFVKFGKLGGDKAIKGDYFKNPLVLYKPGSTFKIEKQKHVYGSATRDTFIHREGYHSGFFLPIFFQHKEGETQWSLKLLTFT